MEKVEIIADVKKKLGFIVEGNDVKSEIQDCLIAAPVSPITVYEIATGFGKSRPALLKIGNKKTLIIISQILHEKNWEKEAVEWNVDLSNCTFVCYNSLHKYIGEHFDFVILDEAHRWSENWPELLSQYAVDRINTNELLLLSGTLTQDIKKSLYGMNLGKPKFYTISIEDAVNWELLPEPQIKVKMLSLDNNNPYLIYEYGKDYKKQTVKCTYNEWVKNHKYVKGTINPNLLIQCTEHQYYTILTERIDYMRKIAIEQGNDKLHTIATALGGQRKRFLGSLKTKMVKKLIQELQGQRVVVFANDIAQAMEFDSDAVHSKNINGQSIINEFNSYKRDLLVSVKQIQESMNLTDPDIGIIVQINNSKSSGKRKISVKNQQSLGRIIRSKTPVLYLFIYRSTQDEVYLNKFKESIDQNWFINV